ncbi:MAG TPA: bacteriohemerythrin [Noviherbaspirillum sp.]
MTIFRWHAHYAIGHATIDAQHRKLIDILNDLHALLNDSNVDHPDTGAGKVFDQLAEYVVMHFAYEEQLIAEAGYPVDKVDAHKKQHNALLRRVQQVMHAYEDGDPTALAELLPYLYGDWLIEHICHSDKDFAPCLEGQAAEARPATGMLTTGLDA